MSERARFGALTWELFKSKLYNGVIEFKWEEQITRITVI
jgi:hypothetical protein